MPRRVLDLLFGRAGFRELTGRRLPQPVRLAASRQPGRPHLVRNPIPEFTGAMRLACALRQERELIAGHEREACRKLVIAWKCQLPPRLFLAEHDRVAADMLAAKRSDIGLPALRKAKHQANASRALLPIG